MSPFSLSSICVYKDVMISFLADSVCGKSLRTRKRFTTPLGTRLMAPESFHAWSFRTASARGKPPLVEAMSMSMWVHLWAVLLYFLSAWVTGEASAVRVENVGDLVYLYSEYLGVIARMSSKRSSSCAFKRSSAFFYGVR